MRNRKRRLSRVLGAGVVALGGFALAAVIATAGFATGTSSTSSTTSTTTTTTTTTTGGEGCTPGYWKQEQHFDSWPISTGTTLNSIFSDTGHSDSVTLLAALSFKGGPTVQDAKNILLRAAAAAYLDSLAVDYALTPGEVVDMVNDALASGDRDTILDVAATLDTLNNAGCPLS